jgi:hypothetical protein
MVGIWCVRVTLINVLLLVIFVLRDIRGMSIVCSRTTVARTAAAATATSSITRRRRVRGRRVMSMAAPTHVVTLVVASRWGSAGDVVPNAGWNPDAGRGGLCPDPSFQELRNGESRITREDLVWSAGVRILSIECCKPEEQLD